MDDPFVDLIIEALNLMHPRFAAAEGLAYSVEEAAGPSAARKEREQPFIREFYHQFRSLWDRALPVKLGLGHVVVQADPGAPAGRRPDFLFWQLGENGQPNRRLGAVSLAFLSNTLGREADILLLDRFRTNPGYPVAISVLIGHLDEISLREDTEAGSIRRIWFDVERWAVRVFES